MELRTRLGRVVGISALLLLATTQWAVAGDRDGEVEWQDVDTKFSRSAPSPEGTPTPSSERRWVGSDPADEKPSAPVPEPGTMTLAAFGLVSLGAALRRRRAARTAERGLGR